MYGHEQPGCQEGRSPQGTGMNVPAALVLASVYAQSEMTLPSL
ncbi:hypothetical protein ACLB1R_01520 [Escherichia coli]